MSRNDDSESWGTGCTIVLALCIVVLLCGGGLLALVGGGYYLAREQIAEARRAEMQAREQAVIAELQAMRLGERPLPPGAHVIAIGPEGEIFWDDELIDLARLEAILQTLVPADERATVPIHIRPGLGAPQEVINRVRELCRGYDQVVEPRPGSLMQIAPEPDSEPPPPVEIQPAK